jgi:hypothetical protein
VGDAEGVAAVGPAVRVREPELELVKLTEPVGLALWVPEVEVELLPVTDLLVVPDKLPLTLGDAVGDGDAEEQTAAPASLLVPTGHCTAVGDVDPGGQKNL